MNLFIYFIIFVWNIYNHQYWYNYLTILVTKSSAVIIWYVYINLIYLPGYAYILMIHVGFVMCVPAYGLFEDIWKCW